MQIRGDGSPHEALRPGGPALTGRVGSWAPSSIRALGSTRRVGRTVPLAALAALAVLAACAVTPATGERELSLVSESQEIQMGRESDPQIVSTFGLVEDEAL